MTLEEAMALLQALHSRLAHSTTAGVEAWPEYAQLKRLVPLEKHLPYSLKQVLELGETQYARQEKDGALGDD